MDKLQKFDYMQNIESYLEQKQVYELFEDLLKQLIVHKPKDPLEFITDKLKQQQGKHLSLTSSPTRVCNRHAWCLSAGSIRRTCQALQMEPDSRGRSAA
jgi:hypothetical protein